MNILIVTGLSGAGKSCVLSALEDRGYYCVDNLPSALLADFTKLCTRRNMGEEKIAVAIDGREYSLEKNTEVGFSQFDSMEARYEILYLECRDDVIAKRYNETRHRHPMNDDVMKGIEIEREYLRSMRDRANFILDTSDLKANELRSELERVLSIKSETQPFQLVIQSFGYKRGVPLETDITMDMRFVLNPYYEESLRKLTGLDEKIKNYLIENDSYIIDFLDKLIAELTILIPKYIEQGKHRLMISFGCTGGRHRSVFAADYVYKHMKDMYSTSIIHRDMSTWGKDRAN